jgi:hypothetical protein
MYVSGEVRISYKYKKVKLSPQKTVEAYMYVSCEIRTSFTYKNVKLSPQEAVKAYRVVSCKGCTLSRKQATRISSFRMLMIMPQMYADSGRNRHMCTYSDKCLNMGQSEENRAENTRSLHDYVAFNIQIE